MGSLHKSQYKELLEFKSVSNNNQYTLLDFATGYLRHKIQQLKKHYGLLFLEKTEEVPISLEEYMEALDLIAHKLISTDFSHITKKIGQVINFILNFNQDIWKTEPIINLNKTIEVILDIEQLKQWVEQCDPQYSNKDSFELSIIAHPGIFYVDFILEDSQGKELFFKDLSSGEQQLIFNTNTIIYHINNLNSTHKSIAKDEILRPRYKYLNIVLDEIELYYHPEFQRKFIQTLIDELDKYSKNVDLPDRIESINICFLTHSPFILSDIPSQNVLKLKDGIPQPNDVTNNSFAANIHDLLNDEFFLKNGTMGEFVRKKITEILEKKIIEIDDLKVIDLIGDPFLKGVALSKIKENMSIEAIDKVIERLNELKINKRNDATDS